MLPVPLLAVLAALAPRQDGPPAEAEPAPPAAAVAPLVPVDPAGWLGAELLMPDGTKVGLLRDLVADVSPGRVRYLVVERAGSTSHALPAAAVQPVSDAERAATRRDAARNAGRGAAIHLRADDVPADDWPVIKPGDWPEDAPYYMRQRFRATGGGPVPYREDDGPTAYRVSSFPGVNVRLPGSDRDVGVIERVWVTPDFARVAAVGVRLRGDNPRTVALRPEELSMDSLDGDIFLSIRADPARLAAAPTLAEPTGEDDPPRMSADAYAALTRYWSGEADADDRTDAAEDGAEPAAETAGDTR